MGGARGWGGAGELVYWGQGFSVEWGVPGLGSWFTGDSFGLGNGNFWRWMTVTDTKQLFMPQN